MRFFSLMMLFLLFPSLNAISEFNYLFEEREPLSLYVLLLAPQDCNRIFFKNDAFDAGLLPPNADEIRKNYFESADELEAARKIAKYLPSQFVASVPNGWVSFLCYSHAINSVNLASRAVKTSFTYLDERFSLLDSYLGDEYYAGGGLKSEKESVESELLNSHPISNLAESTLSASKKLKSFWSEFPFQTDKVSAISDLAGRQGALKDSLIFSAKINAAISAMDSQYLNLSRTYPAALFGAEQSLKTLKGQSIGKILLSALPRNELCGTPPKIGAPFYELEVSLENEVAEAKSLHSGSNNVFSDKQRGYLAVSISFASSSAHKLMEAKAAASEAQTSAIALKRYLENCIRQLEADASAILEKKSDEPFSYSYLKVKLGQYFALKGKLDPDAQLGNSINQLGDTLKQLESFYDAASASDAVAFKIYELTGQIESDLEMADAGESDGLQLQAEKLELNQLLRSLKAADPAADPDFIASMEARVSEIGQQIRQKASMEFSGLDDEYAFLLRNREFLSPERQLSLSGYSRFFDGGQIDYSAAIGSLSKVRNFFDNAAAKLGDRRPELVSASLLGNMVVTQVSEPAALDSPARFVAYVSIENPQTLDPAGARLPLPVPSGAKVLNSSGNLHLENDGGNSVLVVGADSEKYFATLEYFETVNTLKSDKFRIESADQDEIVAKRTVEFQTSKYSHVILQLDRISDDFSVSYPYAHTGSAEGSEIGLLLDALPGSNSLEITFRIKNPFGIAYRETRLDQNAIMADITFANNKLDLPETNLRFAHYTECEISKVMVIESENEIQGLSQGNYLIFSFRVINWKKNELKTVRLKLICNNELSSLINDQLDRIPANQSFEEALLAETAKQQFSQGNYGGAIDIIRKLQNRSSAPDFVPPYYNSLLDASDFMVRENYFADVGEGIKRHLDSGNYEDAGSLIDAFLKGKLDSIKKECNSGCDSGLSQLLQLLNAQQLTSQYSEAVKTAKTAEELVQQKTRRESESTDEKNYAVSNASLLLESAGAALDNFAAYFWADQENSASLKGNFVYKSASVPKAQLDKLIPLVSSIKNAVETDSSNKYSVDYIRTQLSALESATGGLSSSNNQIKSLAEKEFSVADKRQVQFGSSQTADLLAKARDELQSEHYYLAYRLSSSINSELLPAPPSERKDDNLMIAIPAILILAGLSYYFLFRNKGELVMNGGFAD